jgi:hypothetical protein
MRRYVTRSVVICDTCLARASSSGDAGGDPTWRALGRRDALSRAFHQRFKIVS